MEIRTLAAAGYSLWEAECVASGTGIGSGSIELEYGWQLASIPIGYGYWDSTTHAHIHDDVTVAKFENYVLDQITDLYGSGVVEVANTYLGDVQEFYSYVVGSTPPSSKHNWQLIYDDGIHREVSGFWIKIIGGSAPYVITWGE
jgi:hypothetical protein